MSRKVLIVGAGQSGLQLALGLQQNGYDVTVMSARTPDEIRGGRVMSTQAMFHRSLQIERDLGLNFWEAQAPQIKGIRVALGQDGQPALSWTGRFQEGYCQSVDQRVKMPGWMEEFDKRGGKVIIHPVTVSDLDGFSKIQMYDITIIAAGKGELVEMFGRDPDRSPYTEPQRALSVVYVDGLEPIEGAEDIRPVSINLIPGEGELFIIPALTGTGPCDILFFEGVPGAKFDCFSGIRGGEDQLNLTLELMKKYVPWEWQRARDVKLSDWGGFLKGRYAPVVRNPAGRLPSGSLVLGMADVVVANDPITGQGSNNAAHCAAIYQREILEHGSKPFDEDFMQKVFSSYWDGYAQYPTIWTNAMLQPPPPHVQQILGAAQAHQQVADRFAEGFNQPKEFFDWLMDPEKTASYLEQVAAGDAAEGTKAGSLFRRLRRK